MKSLVKHLSILSSGEVIDCTARSTVEVLGIPPRIRTHGSCDILVFDLLSRTPQLPMYLMAKSCGYKTPKAVASAGLWSIMHPSNIQYWDPPAHSRRWGYFLGHACHSHAGVYTRENYLAWLLSRYMGGAITSGSVPQDWVNARTQRAARQWSINIISSRRGLCALGSSTLVVVVGDTDLLQSSGLASDDGKVEISSLLDLKSALGKLDLGEMLRHTSSDVLENSTVDLQKLPKALKFDGLMVPYRQCDSLREALLLGALLSHGYEDGCLLATPPNEYEAEITAWEFRRQIELYLQSYSWEVDRGMGHSKSTAPMMLRGSHIPQHVLEYLDRSPILRERAVDILQRTLKERKRNLDVTFRTTGPKKSLERAYMQERTDPTVPDILTDYNLWRASIDSLFGGVDPKYSTTEGFDNYQAEQHLYILELDVTEYTPEAGRSVVPMVNYMERAGLTRLAYPVYVRLLLAASLSEVTNLGVLKGLVHRSARLPKGMPLGAHSSSPMREQTSPYDLSLGFYSSGELLIHPWVGRRIEEIAAEHGLEHPPEVAALLERAREGNLLSKSQQLYDWYRLLAVECNLY